MGASGRLALNRSVKLCALLLGGTILFVLLDFLVDLRPAGIDSSYRFRVGELAFDRPRILQQDNLSILVIHRSTSGIAALEQDAARLQDPDSQASRQPDYARNRLRSKEPDYFVAYAIGTDLGCPLQVDGELLKESCGPARYDFAGRGLKGERDFRNLSIPDYNFTDDYQTLTIRP